MKRILLILLSLSVTFSCYCNNELKDGNLGIEFPQNSKVKIKKDRITIYVCKDVNGDIIIPKKPLEVMVMEYDKLGYINKYSHYIDGENTGVIRYSYDENNNLYMTNHIRGELVSKIYKNNNGNWVQYFNGEIIVRKDNYDLKKPKRTMLLMFMSNLLTAKGVREINYKTVKRELTLADKNNDEGYFTYLRPDNSAKETLYVTREILEYYSK